MKPSWIRRTVVATLALLMMGAGAPAGAQWLLILRVGVQSTPQSPSEAPVTRIEYLGFDDFEMCVLAYQAARSSNGRPTIFFMPGAFQRLHRMQLHHLSSIESMTAGSVAFHRGARCARHQHEAVECRVDACLQLWLKPPPPPLVPPEEEVGPAEAARAPVVRIHGRDDALQAEEEAKQQARQERIEAERRADDPIGPPVDDLEPREGKMQDRHLDAIEQEPEAGHGDPPPPLVPVAGPAMPSRPPPPRPDPVDAALPAPDAAQGRERPEGVNATGLDVGTNVVRHTVALPFVRVHRDRVFQLLQGFGRLGGSGPRQ